VFRGVGSNGEGGGGVGEVKNWFGQEEGFQGVEGGLTDGGPVPLEVLLGEVNEGAGDIGVIWDESPVEVGEAKEGAYVFDLNWGWPFGNTVEFDGVHSKLTGFDDHPEVFYLVCGKFALLKFEVQVKFGHSLKNTFGVFFVSSGVGGEDEEVIHIDDKPSFCNHVPEGVVYESLKSGRRVG